MTTKSAQREGFWNLAKDVHGLIAVSGVLSGLGALAYVVPAVMATELARTVLPLMSGGAVDAVHAWGLVAALIVGVALATTLQGAGYAVSHRADLIFAESLRLRQVDKLTRLPLEWFTRTASGRVRTLVQDDVSKVHQLVAHVVPDVTTAIVLPVASLAILFATDWRLGLLSLVPIAMVVITFPFVMRDMQDKSQRYADSLADMSASVTEFIRGIAPIKVFQVDGKGHRRFLEQSTRFVRFYLEWVRATVHPLALVMVFASPVFAVAVVAGGTSLLISAGNISPITIVPAVLLAGGIATPLFRLAHMMNFIRDAKVAAGRLEDFFALSDARAPETPLVPADASVALRHVNFSYGAETPAVADIQLELRPGTVTALVGPSGSGKSTLAALVPRLLIAQSGTITHGGVDLSDISERELYRHVGFVFQQPYLLRMTVRDNIRLGVPEADEVAVLDAARAAQIHERIVQLPRGYDSVLGEDARLSGGEQQRLSIARALLTNAPVLVLDEATAFADPDSEIEIQRALAQLTRGRTILVIAHRLHTIVNVDQIAVMERGRIVESGRHDDLLAIGGLYARMWRLYERTRDRAAIDEHAAVFTEGERR